MDTKKILLLLLSYIIWGLILFVFLKPNNDKTYQSYIEINSNKLEELLTKTKEINDKITEGNKVPSNTNVQQQQQQQQLQSQIQIVNTIIQKCSFHLVLFHLEKG